jgi:diguanylate cyclase (GGDEF)-like protein
MNKALNNQINIFEFKHRLADGQRRDVEVFAGPIKIHDSEFLFSIIHDITERKIAEERIHYMTFHDRLTGLYNRAYIEEEMQRIDTERQLPISLIMGDLNNLKLVNDTYGHEKGDELLVKAAEVLKKSCRKEDIVARWGGDEFVVLLPQTPLEISDKICGRIYNETQKEEQELLVSIALGSASKVENDEEIFKVLNKAENRMYKNKITNRNSARSNVLSALLNTLREKSYETEEHSSRMKELCLKLGKKMGLQSSDLDRLSLLTSLHDIGKVTIPRELLNKEEKLTEEEWERIKKHTEASFRILSSIDEFSDIAKPALHHHEWWDGSGYPEGLSGKNIPILSRILTIVDAFDVMVSGRPYQEPVSKQEALEEIQECAGTQFDPNIVAEFVESIEEE